jgi:DUF1680 family protein
LRDLAPSGWLAGELERLAQGLPGHLDGFSAACRPEHNPWAEPLTNNAPANDLLPQWLRGAIPLAQLAHDDRLQGKTRAWIDTILASQQGDGWLGPVSLREQRQLWPGTVLLQALIAYAGAPGDPRARTAIERHLAWLHRLPAEQLLPEADHAWQMADLVSAAAWLYERTGEPWLPELARRAHKRAGDWQLLLPTRDDHSFVAGFRESAEYFRFSGEPALRATPALRWGQLHRERGFMPGGVFLPEDPDSGADPDPSFGAHACVTTALMNSFARLLALTGDAAWAERCEDIAFNTLPAIYSLNALALRSLTAPNQVASAGPAGTFTPQGPDCCRHTAHQGWPTLAAHLWMTTVDGGLAAAMYGPGSVKARVARDIEVTIEETTSYPFEGLATFALSLAQPAKFPLYLRVPAWVSAKPGLRLNGRALGLGGKQGPWIAIERLWRDQDRLELRLPMEPRVRLAPAEPNRATVGYGPLTFSLQIREEWEVTGGSFDWPEKSVSASSPWNVALALPSGKADTALTVARRLGPLPLQPFNSEDPPIRLIAPVLPLLNWQAPVEGTTPRLAHNLEVGPGSPMEATLIPMGCARLRLTVFPCVILGDKPRAH